MDVPVLYLGPEGTHSHEAALRRFGARCRLLPCLSHYDVVDRLRAPAARPRPLAVVPVENSSEGPVTQTLDLLAAHPEISILEGFSMPVRHHLLAGRALKRLEEIERVYSHPQALGQCRSSLRKLVPRAELLAESSTAAAARRAAAEPGSAAVASSAAARIHRLSALARNLQDSDANVTRFFVVTANRRAARPAAPRAGAMRSLLYLVIGNRPGALLHALAPFDAAGLNLTFIQSRPLPGRPWEYGFFVEAATDWKAPAAEAAWRLVLALSEAGRKLGTYPVR
ncbi:MAG: prephenate dehydratase domain-containing protein [Kiritimatiellia bacterium]|jgi:chorismate mutase/prephenate dehydratase|nr:prephenate dehydratase domain-containing protein [Kiritimatiellia bacterium]MDD4172816.1 prephenate dehydratase domain-containing protein [Kiritimatiellia bacterium]MDD4440956.1 prephenate dehydratase domain-containing protein [Kiritimatiellia bacterium]